MASAGGVSAGVGLLRKKKVNPGRSGALQRAAALRMTARGSLPPLQPAKPELTEDQRQEIKEAFELFDTEKTGRIDYHELKVGCTRD